MCDASAFISVSLNDPTSTVTTNFLSDRKYMIFINHLIKCKGKGVLVCVLKAFMWWGKIISGLNLFASFILARAD